MECEKCRTETDTSTAYKFWYGTLLRSLTTQEDRGNVHTTTTIKSYQIRGWDAVSICDECVIRYYRKQSKETFFYALVGSAILLVIDFFFNLYTGFFFPGSSLSGFEAIIAITLFIGTILAVLLVIGSGIGWVDWATRRKLKVRGDDPDFFATSSAEQMAIEMRKGSLQEQGSNSFFTRWQHARLK